MLRQSHPLFSQSTLVFLLLIILGLLGNYFKVTLFFPIDFIFGSIATLIIVDRYGLLYGVFGALVISSYTHVLWNQPYMIVVMTLEALCTGVLLRTRYKSLFFADVLFWLFLGIPLGWLLYYWGLRTDGLISTLIALKHAVNGIFNAMIASLVLHYLSIYPWGNRARGQAALPLQEIMFNLLVMLVLLPSFFVIVQYSQEELKRIEHLIVERLQVSSAHVTENLNLWYEQHLGNVARLAQSAVEKGVIPSEPLMNDTKVLATASSGFYSMYVANAEGTTVAFYPPVNAKGESTVGLNFAERPYFRIARDTRQPVLSEVFMGRKAVSKPMVTLAVPIVQDNQWVGLAAGGLNLDLISRFIWDERTWAQSATLIDLQNRVIVSTVEGRQALLPFTRGQGDLLPLEDDIYYWLPGKGDLPSLMRWSKSFYISETVVSDRIPWKLILEIPAAPQHIHLYRACIRHFSGMLGLVLLAMVLAMMLSRRIVIPLKVLTEATTHVPQFSEQHPLAFNWPDSFATEIQALSMNFEAMTRTLKKNFQELRRQKQELSTVNDALTAEIQRRSAMEQEQTRLFEAVEQAAETVIITDSDCKILYCNPAFERISGYPCEEVVGKEYRFWKGEDTHESLQKALQHIGRTHEAWHGNLLNKRKDGTLFEVEATISPIRDNEHVITNYVVVERDVTQEVQLRRQLMQAQKMEAIGTLAGGIAHDFNNILGAIFGYAEMALLSKTDPVQVEHHLHGVLEAGRRARELVQQILSFSRKAESESRSVLIQSIVKEAMKLVRASLPSTIEIRRHLHSSGVVQADSSRIHQILMNLCANAQHAMSARGGVLEVGLEDVELQEQAGGALELKPGAYVKLTVADTGHGMSDSVMERIFDPYFTTKPAGEGTGLGLAVVHGIIKSLHGAIDVHSVPNQGTRFSIYLPRVDKQPPVQAEPPRSSEPMLGGRERVMLVDDEETLVAVGSEMLMHLGYEVTAMTSGVEAVERLRAEPERFDVLITDQTMPRMRGVELAREAKRIRPDLPIILCSGLGDIINEEQMQRAGIAAFLAKPFSIHTLTTTLRRVLDAQASKKNAVPEDRDPREEP